MLLCVGESLRAQTLVLESADFQLEGVGDWTALRLPDNWVSRGLEGKGSGQYRFSFNLPEVPSRSTHLALRGTRLSTVHQISLNGVTLQSRESGIANRALARPMPFFLEIAVGQFHAGENTLLVNVTCAARCGLSSLQLGPTDEMLRQHLHHEALWQTAPQLLNAFTVGLAVFMLLVWWRRPTERAIGIFALLWLPTFVRCYSYFVTYSSLPQIAIEATFFAINSSTTALFVLFSLELSNHSSTIARKTIWGFLVALPLIALAGGLSDQVALLRRVFYPLQILAMVYALWMLWQANRAKRSATLVALQISMVALTIAAGHDVLYIKGWFTLDEFFWMPWVAPLFFMSFSAMLLGRMVRALDEAEELNVHLENRVALRTADLQSANQAQTRFIAAASHDLRQPLHTLGLLLGILRERVSSSDGRDILSRVDAAVQSMDALLHGILDVSRLDAQVEKPVIQAVSLAAVWTHIERAFAAQASRQFIQLRFRHTEIWVASDVHMLQRIVNNLVSNALRYTSQGGVLVSARVRGEQALIEVWDTGIGIPADRQQDVFDEFVQLNNPQHDRNLGLGLGLAIVKRTVKLLGHTLSLRSRVGRGSVFELALQRVNVPRAPIATSGMELNWNVAGMFVLVVDDEQDSRFAMQALLSDWGCLVIAASSGNEAMAALESCMRDPDALLLDYRLPGETGLHIARRLLTVLEAQTPILIVTGDVAADAVLEVSGSGHDVMHKPVNPVELRAWLGRVNQQRQYSEKQRLETPALMFGGHHARCNL
jgi:signal transduction histidine kinase/ActR/RegA family two-component response regulator